MSDVRTMDRGPPDGGWGWFVVIATFLSTALTAGIMYTFGVLYVAFLDAFGQTKAATSLIYTIYTLTSIFAMPLSLKISRRFGHRTSVIASGITMSIGLMSTSFTTSLYHVYFTYGVIVGCGGALGYMPCIEMVGFYFKKRLSLAMGFAMAGSGAGHFILSFVSQILIDMYGWRGTLMIMSALVANICVAGALLRPLGHTRVKSANEINKSADVDSEKFLENGETHDVRESSSKGTRDDNGHRVSSKGTRDDNGHRDRCKSCLSPFVNFAVFKYPIYYVIVLTGILQTIGHGIITVHIVKRALDFGISGTLSSLITAAIGLTQMVGRPIIGTVGHVSKINPCILYSMSMALCGISTIASIYLRSFAGQLVYGIFFGVGFGGYIIHIPIVVAHFLDSSNIGPGTTMVFQVHCVTLMIIVPLTGWMRDVTGVYDAVFWLAGLCLVAGGVIALLLPMINRIMKSREKSKDDYKAAGKHELDTEEKTGAFLMGESISAL